MKNIKESLRRMQKFILNKTIKGNKANDIKDLEGVGKVVCSFISAFYKSYWDKLSIDEQNLSFRNKVKAQFSSQSVKETNNNKGKNTVNLTYVFTLSSPIPAKSPKKVIKISKYFKKIQFLRKINLMLKYYLMVLIQLEKH